MDSAKNSSSKIPEPPKGWSALLWRLPIWIYRIRLGWLLGHRAHVTIRVAGKEIRAHAERLSFSKAHDTFKAYHQRHPKALQGLAKLIGYQISENVAEILDFFSHNIPVIAFHPIDTAGS